MVLAQARAPFTARIGEILRGERATLGRSLLDVQRELKIRAIYIDAIENADPSAFDPDSDYHDPKSKPDAPTWFQVTIKPVRSVDPPLSLARLREVPALARMELLRKGSRLSVQAVTDAEWKAVLDLAGVKPAKKTRKG